MGADEDAGNEITKRDPCKTGRFSRSSYCKSKDPSRPSGPVRRSSVRIAYNSRKSKKELEGRGLLKADEDAGNEITKRDPCKSGVFPDLVTARAKIHPDLQVRFEEVVSQLLTIVESPRRN